MTEQEFLDSLRTKLKSLANLFTTEDFLEIRDTVRRELRWSFPVVGDFKEFWFLERGLRHALFILLTDSASRFKYKQINLQHRFEHYRALVRDMDIKFMAEQAANPAEFAGVAPFKMFGTKIDAGFSYDEIGQNTTYEDTNQVNFSPKQGD
jgi:hypothetical protein